MAENWTDVSALADVPDDDVTAVTVGGAELALYGVENTDHMVTETLIRGMYNYWRKVMEI